MKKLLIVFVFSVLVFTNCQQASETTENGTNSEPKPAEDLKTTLSKLENGAYEAWKKKDGKFFEGFLHNGFVGNGPNGPTPKEVTVKAMGDNPCEVKSFKIMDEAATEIGDSAALLTTKFEADYTCKAEDGKEFSGPSPSYAASLYVKSGDSWQAIYHQTVPASDAKGETPPAGDGEATKEEESEPDEMTKTLGDLDKKFWEAWAKKDGTVFEEGLGSNFREIGPNGVLDKAGAIKAATEHPCEITSSSFSGSKAVKVTDNLYMYMTKGAMEGTCGDDPLPKGMNATTIFAKEGADWKPVFHTATPIA